MRSSAGSRSSHQNDLPILHSLGHRHSLKATNSVVFEQRNMSSCFAKECELEAHRFSLGNAVSSQAENMFVGDDQAWRRPAGR
jgi:hypothetical protein